MKRLRSLLDSLRLKLALLLLVSMSGAGLLGGFVTWRAALGAGQIVQKSPAAIWRHLPDYGILLLLISLGLTLVAVRRVTRPLSRLADATAAFAVSLDPRPLAPGGPSEFQPVLDAFNLMQRRVSEGFQERVHMLSAINHDLRTPLARLALRLDQVSDLDLRARLRADVVLLDGMVARGMQLARGGEAQEARAPIDLTALLQTIADEAVEMGNDVSCDLACHGVVQARPETLLRCITNLVDNAVRYGGSARLTCEMSRGVTQIIVLDDGPGVAEEQLEAAFRPFTRLGHPGRQVDGSGLGLTIARQQARSLNGDVRLENRKAGGLAAIITLPNS